MPNEIFIFEKTVYLGDTNAEGNVYFAKYFDWQGQAREEFYRRNYPLDLLMNGLKLITVHASNVYKKEVFFYDEITINVSIGNLKNMSLELLFLFTKKNTSEVVSKGLQKIAFADAHGKIIPVPQIIREISQKFILPETEYTNFAKEFQKQ